MMYKRVKTMVKAVLVGLVLAAGLTATAQDTKQKAPETKKEQPAETKSDAVNINTADVDELDELPRIGPAIAKRIIDFRKEHGSFKKLEELMNVSGIGPKTFARLKDRITL